MAQMPDEIMYDVRLIERHIRKGILTRAQVEAKVAELADSTEQADVIDVNTLRNPQSRTPQPG